MYSLLLAIKRHPRRSQEESTFALAKRQELFYPIRMPKKVMTASEMGKKGGKNRVAMLNAEERKALARSGGLAKAAKRGAK